MLQNIDYLTFKDKVIGGRETCALFITRDNCPVCARVKPKFHNIAEEYEDFPFYEMDVYDAPALMMEHNLKSVPQVFFYDQGDLHLNISGDTSEDDLALKVEFLRYYK